MNKKLRITLADILCETVCEEAEAAKSLYTPACSSEAERREVVDKYFEVRARSIKRQRLLAAIVAAVILILTSCTVVVYREQIAGFFVSFYDDHADLDHENPGLAEIDVYYEPTYIPEGYIEEEIDLTKFHAEYTYKKDNKLIYIRQALLDSNGINLDTEDAEHGERMIGDLEVMYARKKGVWSVVWKNESCSFFVMCPDSLTWGEVERIILGLSVV